MREIDNTGERILLDKETPLMIARHRCAYEFAKDFAGGKDVLDIGCGEGYGSNLLADEAHEVLGIDYDTMVIEYAQDKYRRENLTFSVMDVENLGLVTRKFDVICSFQNIEHIRDTSKLLGNIYQLLNERGVFICSTCNIKDASPGRNTPFNKFHVKEYGADEFTNLLESRFGRAKVFGLKRGSRLRFYRRMKKIGFFNFLPEHLDPVKRFYKNARCDNFFWTDKDIGNGLDFIAVCNK